MSTSQFCCLFVFFLVSQNSAHVIQNEGLFRIGIKEEQNKEDHINPGTSKDAKGEQKDYMEDRQNILDAEQLLMTGGTLELDDTEAIVNAILMAFKNQEFDDGLAYQNFPPASHFFHVKEQINKSDVFQIIKMMPKGAVLHVHDGAYTSMEFVVYNLTYRDNLYYCLDNGALKFHFFVTPDTSCQWQQLSMLRQTAGNKMVDDWLMDYLTLFVPDPEDEYEDIDHVWIKFERIFDAMSSLLRYRPVFEDYVRQSIEELYQDNVQYIETRCGVRKLYDMNETIYNDTQYFNIYKRLSSDVVASHDDLYSFRIITTVNRMSEPEIVRFKYRNAQRYATDFPGFVVGFDLVGQEDKGTPLIDYYKVLLEEYNPNISLSHFFHAGETNWYGTEKDENLVDAFLMKTKRIGHGYAITKHPVIMELARNKSIALEVCPLSNQVLKLVADLRNHPASSLVAEGFPMVISSDDPAMWGAAGLSYDFYEALMGFGGANADLRTLKQWALNSITYSSLSESEKNDLRDIWQGKWNQFLQDVIAKYQGRDA